MNSIEMDMNRSLMLDGNAAAGVLDEIFALEMTTSPIGCTHCGRQGAVGTLLVFNQAPGIVLRCPVCENIVMRIVQVAGAIYLDMRGAAFLRLERALAG